MKHPPCFAEPNEPTSKTQHCLKLSNPCETIEKSGKWTKSETKKKVLKPIVILWENLDRANMEEFVDRFGDLGKLGPGHNSRQQASLLLFRDVSSTHDGIHIDGVANMPQEWQRSGSSGKHCQVEDAINAPQGFLFTFT